jgi:hypothetical protein
VRLIFITLLALLLATIVGLGSTWLTATRGTDLGTLTIGAWTARPKTGTADVDPYSRASIARSGELPVGTGDGVAFSATTDDRKRPLDGRCDVVVSGVTPAARFWTLTLYDQKGHLVANCCSVMASPARRSSAARTAPSRSGWRRGRAPETGSRPAGSSVMR